MAAVDFTLSKKVQKGTGLSEILIRLQVKRGMAQRAKSHLFILPKYFVDGEIVIKSRLMTPEVKEAFKVRGQLDDIRDLLISESHSLLGDSIPENWVQNKIDKFLFPEEYERVEEKNLPFFQLFDKFIEESELSELRVRQYNVVKRALMRFEIYKRLDLNIATINEDIFEAFKKFLAEEHTLFTTNAEGERVPIPSYKRVMEFFPEKKNPGQRGENTIVSNLKKLKAFIHWCEKKGYISNDPFRNCTPGTQSYGTPYYLTSEERDKVYNHKFPLGSKLDQQRDVFIFQCFVGCRISDLYKLTQDNIIKDKNGYAIEYIPEKTKHIKQRTVKVYLAPTALAILEKYKGKLAKGILPLIPQQHYNYAIKSVIENSKIDRKVPILNPITRETEMKPISEVASSHMARRTFIGNLYKKVKDPNLIGKLSGHSEGSRAFARYRDIDDDMIKDLTDLL